MDVVTRSAPFLAALASAALPGLDPVRVQSVRHRPGDLFDVAFVEDSEERRWVVQAPRTPVAGAMLEDITELSTLLGRRLDIAVPMVRGQVVVPEGRAVVYPRLPGRPLDFAALPEGLGLAADLGRAIAHVHNLEVDLFEEAGRPTYDAQATRSRLLTDLDRAAATGHVPTGLLSRWEHALEDVSLWRFVPTPVHGSLVGANVLASFDDEDDADSGRIRAVSGWEESHVGDPAEDFADLAAHASEAALESVLAAYAPSRIDRPDARLTDRARLCAQLRLIRRLLRALAADERGLVDQAAADLRALEERVYAEDTRRETEQATRPKPRRPLLNETSSDDQPGPHDESVDAKLQGEPVEDAEPDTGERSAPTPRPRVAPAHLDTVAVPQDSRRDAGAPDAGATVATAPADVARSRAPAIEFEFEGAFATEPQAPDAPDASAAPGEAAGDPSAVGTGEETPDDSVLDLHEGASEFVPVEPRRAAPEPPPVS